MWWRSNRENLLKKSSSPAKLLGGDSVNDEGCKGNEGGFESEDHSEDHTHLNGSLDEIRLSNVARSASWITAEYNNQSSPSTFYSVGSTF